MDPLHSLDNLNKLLFVGVQNFAMPVVVSTDRFPRH